MQSKDANKAEEMEEGERRRTKEDEGKRRGLDSSSGALLRGNMLGVTKVACVPVGARVGHARPVFAELEVLVCACGALRARPLEAVPVVALADLFVVRGRGVLGTPSHCSPATSSSSSSSSS